MTPGPCTADDWEADVSAEIRKEKLPEPLERQFGKRKCCKGCEMRRIRPHCIRNRLKLAEGCQPCALAALDDSFQTHDGGDTFLRNVGCYKNQMAASHPRRQHSPTPVHVSHWPARWSWEAHGEPIRSGGALVVLPGASCQPITRPATCFTSL
jgi:hypothetical protein